MGGVSCRVIREGEWVVEGCSIKENGIPFLFTSSAKMSFAVYMK